MVEGYRAKPEGTPRGGLVVLHEAFGVTPHIRRVADSWAAEGYAVVAPNLFARFGVMEALPQNKAGLDQGRDLIMSRPMQVFLDGEVTDCVKEMQALLPEGGKVATLGFCWGGSLAFASSALVEGVACANAYYGGKIADLARALAPKVPVEVHLAELDRYIDFAEAAAALAPLAPGVTTYAYAADHGFNRDDGVTYDPQAAATARGRTAAFVAKWVG